MLNIGPAELLVVLVVALLVLGPNKLPDAARQVGRAIGEMRKLSNGFQAEMRGALKEPVESKPRPGANATKPAKTGGSLASPRVPSGDLGEDEDKAALAGRATTDRQAIATTDDQATTTTDAAAAPSSPPAGEPDVGSARLVADSPPALAEPGTDGATAT